MSINKELVQRLYEQATAKCHTNDAWTFEIEFTKAIVLECSRVAKLEMGEDRVCDAIEHHFGIE